MVHGEIEAGRTFEIDAYARYSAGELMLYDSEEAADHFLIYPYCLTASSQELVTDGGSRFDGEWVRVVGTFVAEDRYDDPPNVIRTVGTAGGLPFRNQCWSPLLLLIEQIELIEPIAKAAN